MNEEHRPIMLEPGTFHRHRKSEDCTLVGCKPAPTLVSHDDDAKDAARWRWFATKAQRRHIQPNGVSYWHFPLLYHQTNTVEEAVEKLMAEDQQP